MPATKPAFTNFTVDHMTLLVKPEMYNVTYLLFRNILGVAKDDIVYNVRKEWKPGQGDQSLTFASRLGRVDSRGDKLTDTLIALVQPTEPKSDFSHVRTMLDDHRASCHWQHIALRTPDLLAFHKHALARGARFITPILKDDRDDLIQVFSGEWFHPGSPASAMFFEFVQRDPTPELMKMIEEQNRQSLFRDKTFLGLYGEKQREYESGKVVPFIDPPLYELLISLLGEKKFWDISEDDVRKADDIMLDYGKKYPEPVLP